MNRCRYITVDFATFASQNGDCIMSINVSENDFVSQLLHDKDESNFKKTFF
jgi:hypothetical protein